MKKLVAILLVAVVVMASAFAFSFLSLGIETGAGFSSDRRCDGVYLSGDMEIVDNLDIYVRFGHSTAINLSFGGQYKVADFKLSGTKVDFKPGLQMGFDFGDGYFIFKTLATAQLSFDAGHIGAFLRPGVGLSVASVKVGSNKRESDANFEIIVETGVVYLF